MSTEINSKMASLGYWSSIVMTVMVIFSGITATTAVKIPSVITGILLIPAFILLMACIHELTSVELKLFSRLGLVFATGYAVLIGFNYFMQLTLVRQGLYTEPFDMANPQSVMWLIEVLGYGFMGLATLSASFVFSGGKLGYAIRWLFILNGILGIGGMIGYALGWSMNLLLGGLVVWDIIMPISSILLAILFRRTMKISESLPQPTFQKL